MKEYNNTEIDEIISQTLKSEYTDITVSDELKKATLSAIKESRVPTPKSKPSVLQFHRRRRGFALIAATLSLLLIGGTGTVAYASEAAYVNVESNVSVDLKINYFSRVIEASALDGESQELLDSLGILNKTYDEALTLLVEADPNAKVDVIVSSSSSNRAGKLTSGCATVLTQSDSIGFCEQMSYEDRKLAEEQDMSMGTYKMYSDLTQAGVEITAEEAQSLSHHQLCNMMTDNNVIDDSLGQGNTSGKGTGNNASTGSGFTQENGAGSESKTGQSDEDTQSTGSNGTMGTGNGNGTGNGMGSSSMAGSGGGMGKMSE